MHLLLDSLYTSRHDLVIQAVTMAWSAEERAQRSKTTCTSGIRKKAATVGCLTNLPIVVLYLNESGQPTGFKSYKGLIQHFELGNVIENPLTLPEVLTQGDIRKLLAKRTGLL